MITDKTPNMHFTKYENTTLAPSCTDVFESFLA